MVWCLQLDAQKLEYGGEKPFGLSPWKAKEQAPGQRSLDGCVSVVPLPATDSSAAWLPGSDDLRGEPEGQITTAGEGSVVA